MATPTFEQLTELHKQAEAGRITRENIQAFLRNPNQFVTTCFSTTFDQALGLTKLIQLAVGEKNLCNIDSNITPERFKLVGTGVRTVVLELAPFLDDETGKQAAKRLVSEGYTLENIGELAGFLRQYPAEVEKYNAVAALGEDSRWTNPADDRVLVPYACVGGARRFFGLAWFVHGFGSIRRVLVSRPSK